MKKLIEIQEVITRIEELTLDVKFHSSFNYLNEHELEIKSFCFDQTSVYKKILDNMKGALVIIESNTTIRICYYD